MEKDVRVLALENNKKVSTERQSKRRRRNNTSLCNPKERNVSCADSDDRMIVRVNIVWSRRKFLLICDRSYLALNQQSSDESLVKQENTFAAGKSSTSKSEGGKYNKVSSRDDWICCFKYLPAWHWESLVCFIFTACYILWLFCCSLTTFLRVSLTNFEWISQQVRSMDKQTVDCSIFEHHFLHIFFFCVVTNSRVSVRWTSKQKTVSFSSSFASKVSSFLSATIEWRAAS